MLRDFSHSSALKVGILALLFLCAAAGAVDLPSAVLVQVSPEGVKTEIQLRCVPGTLVQEPYYCEITRRVQGVEMGAAAIYPAQLQSIFARFWIERSEAAGTYPQFDKRASLKWNWKFMERSMTGQYGAGFSPSPETVPALRMDAGWGLDISASPEQDLSNETRAAYWLFGVLRSWSNFSG